MKFFLLLFPVFTLANPLIGRFQVIPGSNPTATILLDTATGKMWKKMCVLQKDASINCEMDAWHEEWIVGVNVTSKVLEGIIQGRIDQEKAKK